MSTDVMAKRFIPLDQMGGASNAWMCPRCHCRDWRVIDTKEAASGHKTRVRVCRHCGKQGPRIYTEERPYRVSE